MCHLSPFGFTQVRDISCAVLTAILSWRSNKDFWDKSQLSSMICYSGSYKCCATLGNNPAFVSPALGLKLCSRSTHLLDSSFCDWWFWCGFALERGQEARDAVRRPASLYWRTHKVEHPCTNVSTFKTNKQTNPPKNKTQLTPQDNTCKPY